MMMKCTRAAALVTIFLTASIVPSYGASVIGPFRDGVPGSGYGCDLPCDDGDVNYVVEAKLQIYTIEGSAQSSHFPGTDDVETFVRTFEGIDAESSPFNCLNGNGTTGPLAPCLQVNPGQTMKIKLINNMDNGMADFNQNMQNMIDYWNRQPGYPAMDNVTFDYTNLHLHGVQVYPHLFYPEGTGDANADWIQTTPASVNRDTQCFCYVFEIPHDHPKGTYLWHIHRHSAAAIQGWQGMAGYLLIGDADTEGSPFNDLKNQGITEIEPFVLWEWVVNLENNSSAAPGAYIIGNFGDQNNKPVLLTNNNYSPELDFCVNETYHMALLCAFTTMGAALHIVHDDDKAVPFWMFASDGISFDKAYEKKMVVVGPGQRQGLLFQFNEPGTYSVMMETFNDDLANDTLSYFTKQVAMTINVHVAGENGCDAITPIDISSLTFTPGMGDRNIAEADVVNQITVQFEVIPPGKDVTFRVDGQLFEISQIMKTVEAGTAQSWQLTSDRKMIHPFHIHVNPFQVIDIDSSYNDIILHGNVSLIDGIRDTSTVPPNQWRDTVFVPPEGTVLIYQQFGGEEDAFSGKTVFHCHFLDHEDQGMMQAIVIADPITTEDETATDGEEETGDEQATEDGEATEDGDSDGGNAEEGETPSTEISKSSTLVSPGVCSAIAAAVTFGVNELMT